MVITHKASLEGGGGGVFYCVCVGWGGWSMIVKNVTSQYRMIMKEGGEHERVWCLSQPDCILPHLSISLTLSIFATKMNISLFM